MATRTKEDLLAQAKLARESRLLEIARNNAAVKIQALMKCIYQRRKFLRTIRVKLDSSLTTSESNRNLPAAAIFKEIQVFVRNCSVKDENDLILFDRITKYITRTILLENVKLNYAGLALDKVHAQSWVIQVKKVLTIAIQLLKELDPCSQQDGKRMIVLLHLLITLTSSKTWGFIKNAKPLEVILEQVCTNILQHIVDSGLYHSIQSVLFKGLCGTKVVLKPASLSAILTLALRPLMREQKEGHITMFILHVLSVPSLLYHVKLHAPETVEVMRKCDLLVCVVKFLDCQQTSKIIFNSLEGSLALCLLANLVDLASVSCDERVQSVIYPSFVSVSTKLLDSCQLYVAAKKSNLTQWHPLLGWFAQNNCDHTPALPYVEKQLQILWSRNLILRIFHCLHTFVGEPDSQNFALVKSEEKLSNAFTNFFKKTLKIDENSAKKVFEKEPKRVYKLGSPEVTQVAHSAVLYEACLTTLSQLRVDILTSLAFCDDFLVKFWNFLRCLGTHCGLKSFVELLAVNSKATAPEFLMLQLFADLMTHFLTVMDDVELFEQQKAFCVSDLLALGQFLNLFLVRAIWNGYVDSKTLSSHGPIQSLHVLLLTLHKRDTRRSFTPDGFWLVTEPKPSHVLMELERNKRPAQTLLQKMPHVIPHADRVVLFRAYVMKEKTALGLTESASVAPQSTLVSIRRSRLVEDGFRQLSLLHPHATKGIIRVKFVNDLGLDEAGIDQDGVFKEFLEETLKRIFDPSLNLFKMTSEQKVYPSPTSYLTENHLELFEFVGRMLGKAVYEGITVDIQFAPFFLHQLLGHTTSAAYSALDDLSSLDPDLYRNLTYLKHYEGDMSDLQLTFSVDEEILGKLVTFDILPGGRATPVTDSNKISYVHQMAHFKLNTQIKEQTQAFLRGFRTVVNPEWLALFSGPELQRLISGDNVPLDVRDLRRHTQYYGGFHDSHRVVQWLWDIVEKEFTDKEQKKFLKFITSCSSPPLLGFAHLEPPFSIRCVEVGDDEDRGDTIGSVLRGFLTLHRKDPVNRLPTASTCFNLLKLPNYQKKSTLREKLKYAIESNSGFELS